MSESTQTVTAEGASVDAAVHQAAQQLGVSPGMVEYKLDYSHFRNSAGRSVGVTSVRIIAWAKDRAAVEALEGGRAWLAKLIELMGMKAEITATLSRSDEKVVELRVSSPDARFLVGRQGVTLHAIQELVDAAMVSAGSPLRWRVDVDGGARDDRPRDDRPRDDRARDDRPRDDRRRDRRDDGDRPRRFDRDDRRFDERRYDRPRDDRPRDDRPRDDRPRDDRPRDDRPRDDRPRDDRRRSDADVDKLRRLAARLAEEVARTGEPTELRRELNSFERRIVHMVVSGIDGVVSESVGDGPTKVVRLMPAPDKKAAPEGSEQA